LPNGNRALECYYGIAAVQEILAPFIAELGTVREELGARRRAARPLSPMRDQLGLEVALLRSILGVNCSPRQSLQNRQSAVAA
jgi:hypothetical protein